MIIIQIALVLVSLIIYAAVNYYIGLKIWKYCGQRISLINGKLYWITLITLSLLYIISILPFKFIPIGIRDTFSRIGAYWLGIILYSFIFLIIADAFMLIFEKTKLKCSFIKKLRINASIVNYVSIIIAICILFYGTYRAYNPNVTHYNVNINKNSGNLKSFHVVLVSDIHLGHIVGSSALSKMVDKINSLKPDVVLICGDTLDNDTESFKAQNMDEVFRRLRTKYGVFAVPGNHDYYIKNDVDNKFECYKYANITLLRDKYAKIAGSIYIVGRDDIESKNSTGSDRKNIKKLLDGVDKSLPVIVLDHQPIDILNEKKNGIDLQLSGHTHGGQMLVSSIINRKIYKQFEYGLFKEENLTVIVTSGYGTGGIPMRTGSRAEIADINISFRK